MSERYEMSSAEDTLRDHQWEAALQKPFQEASLSLLPREHSGRNRRSESYDNSWHRRKRGSLRLQHRRSRSVDGPMWPSSLRSSPSEFDVVDQFDLCGHRDRRHGPEYSARFMLRGRYGRCASDATPTHRNAHRSQAHAQRTSPQARQPHCSHRGASEDESRVGNGCWRCQNRRSCRRQRPHAPRWSDFSFIDSSFGLQGYKRIRRYR